MNFYVNDAESRLIAALPSYNKSVDTIAMKVSLSKLHVRMDKNNSRTIAINILRDQFKSSSGDMYVLSNSDVIVLYKGKDDTILQHCVYHIQYLFAEEGNQPIFTTTLIPQYVTIYRADKWDEFISYCTEIFNNKDVVQKNSGYMLQTISHIIEDELQNIDWSSILLSSDISKIIYSSGNKSIVLKDLYVDYSALNFIAGEKFDIISNPHLKGYIKEFLDFKVLVKLVKLVSNNIENESYIVNLSIHTLKSDEFWELANALSEGVKRKIIIGISLSDIFYDFASFLKIRADLQDVNFKLCLDGLDYLSFMQIDRTSLGFDLVRVIHSNVYDIILLSELEEQVRSKIQVCGSSRVIIQVHNEADVEIAQKFGIILFQNIAGI